MEQTSKNITHTLPDTICIERERREADKALRQAVQDLQSAYRALANIKELAPIGTNIADITEGMVRERIDKRIELVKQDLSLTESEREKRLASWASVRARAARYTKTIEKVLNEWPCASWVYDGTIGTFYCDNIDSVVSDMSTHTVSDEAKEHYHKVWECIDMIRGLREWENKHDIKFQRLADLQCLSAEAFALMWQRADIKFDRVTAAKYGFAVGNPIDPKHPERVII